MAKLVVFDADTEKETAFKRGHVTSVHDDESTMSPEVLNGARMPDGQIRHLWTIIDVPGPASDWQYLLERPEKVIKEGIETFFPRINKLDLPKLKLDAEAVKGGKLQPGEGIVLGKEAIEVAVSVEVPVSDLEI